MSHDEKPTSIWKKEISFKRKPREDEGSTAAARPPQETSVWKREISLRRKPKETAEEQGEAVPAETAPAEAAPAEAAPAEAAPVEAAPVEVAPPEPVATPLPTAPVKPVPPEMPPAAVHEWLTRPLEELSQPPAESAPAVAPSAPPVPPAQPVLAAVPPPSPPQPLQAVPVVPVLPDPPLEQAAPPAPPASEPPAVDVALPAAVLPAAPIPVAPAPPAPPVDELPTAVLPPLPELAAEVGSAIETEVQPEPEPKPAKVPFYKRELSFKRRARETEPEGFEEFPAEKPAKEKKERRPSRLRGRELTFRRGSKDPAAAEPTPAKPAKEPKPPKARRELPKLRRLPLPAPAVAGKGGTKFVGLKIGASQIAAARVVNGSGPELLQAAREPLDAGIVVGGELRDPEALALALKEFFRKHRLPRRGIRLGIANNRIGVRTFDVAGIDDPKQLANAIRFRAQEVLPIPIEEAVLDYQVLSEGVDDEGQPTRRVLLVVAYRELVDRYLYACRKAGLQVVGIDLEAFALLRAVAEPQELLPESERAALVAVSVGHDRSTFAVSDGRVCEFTRVLEWGGWSLNVAIARSLDLSPSEAEPLKRALSLEGDDELPEGFSADQLATARDAARRQLQSFARELVSSLQFYQNQPGSLGIGEIALTGGTAHLPGLSGELERLIGVPVRVADPMARVKVSKRVREREQTGSLAIAIGLGIED